MSAVTLLCRNEDAKRVIGILADLKMVHITDHRKESVGNTLIDIGRPQADAEELSAALIATRNLLSKLPQSGTDPGETPTLEHRIERVREIANAYADHEEQLRVLGKSITAIEQQLAILAFLPDETPLHGLKARSVKTILLRKTPASDKAILDALKPIFVKEKEHSFLLGTTGTVEKDRLPGYEVVDLAPVAHLRGTAIEAAKELAREHATLAHQREQQELAEASFAQHASFLVQSEPIIALELLKAQAPLHFGTTRHITVVRGFIPTKRAGDLQQRLDGEGIRSLVDIAPAQDAPIALDNPRHAKDFESLTSLYTLPKYDEIDPTSLMAITFPIFFGFMLGDIGYGLAALAMFIALRHYAPRIRHFANIFIISAISTIIFGIVYGEFFGAEHILGLELHPLIHRATDLPLMFTIALIIALLHINLGLLIGAINESRHGWLSAVLEKGGWVVAQIGFILLAAKLTILQSLTVFTLETTWTAIAVTFTIAGLGLWYGERETGILKARGLIELLSMFSNMLSYTRLVALGLASVYLAFVINQMAGDLFAKGGLWLLLGIIILVIGHAINLVLGLMGPFLHSLRLHYVEFFTKFYEGGGRPYRPFGTIE